MRQAGGEPRAAARWYVILRCDDLSPRSNAVEQASRWISKCRRASGPLVSSVEAKPVSKQLLELDLRARSVLETRREAEAHSGIGHVDFRKLYARMRAYLASFSPCSTGAALKTSPLC